MIQRKFTVQGLILAMILAVFFSASVVLAQSAPADEGLGLIPCDGSDANPCDFNALMELINEVISFILFGLALPVAAIMFAYAGFLMVTSGGSTEAKGKAKNIFTNAVFGVVIAAGSWLIIKTILVVLGYDGGWIGF